ncbi:MAG: hypothetical protein ACLRXQ_07955 [Phascolarctobacterium faecium]
MCLKKILLQRAQEAEILPMRDLFGQIWRGSMPALNNASEQDWNNYSLPMCRPFCSVTSGR